jgi:hypothetical protein
MKTKKLLGLLLLTIAFWSCSEDEAVVELTQPTFTITAPASESGLYVFENTTPNKELFYTFWELEAGTPKKADSKGSFEYTYDSSGPKTITLTMVSATTNLATSQNIVVTLPPPADDRFLFNPENLLKNGYFAEGTGDDFTSWNKNNGADRITQNTEGNISVRAAKISNPAGGNKWDTQFISAAAPTVSGNKYTVSLWAKGSANVIRFSTNPGVGGDQYGPDYTVTADWAQYSYTFTANSPTTLIALDMGKSAGTFIIDGVELVAGEKALPLPSNNSALLNGDLEVGSGNDFTNWTKNNNSAGITAEVNDVLSGSRAAKISNAAPGPEEWRTQFVSVGFATTVTSSYTASVWIKGDPVEIRFSTNPGGSGQQYAGNYTASSQWTKYSWNFDANTATTLLALDMGKTQGVFIIDAIKVVKN